MKRFGFPLIVCLFALFSLAANAQSEKEVLVLISTEFGDIKVKLFNETPLHRDNFVKLANEGLYDGTLFHRVINQFMIQGGDPATRTDENGQPLGNTPEAYTIPAEIVEGFYHRKGMLSAARQGDNVNPEKRSSGSQFYIVHGRKFKEQDLVQLEQRQNQQRKQAYFQQWLEKPENAEKAAEWNAAQENRDMTAMQACASKWDAQLSLEFAQTGEEFHYTDEQKAAYANVGGAPHLDGAYTVFGEVVEGFDVLDKIAAVKTLAGDRPEKDIKMTVKVLK